MHASETLIRQIHASARPCVLAITGGGTWALPELLRVPGGSRTLLEAVVPYSEAALAKFLRVRPEQFCSEATARVMSVAAWERAVDLTAGMGPAGQLLGIGCTASLASEPPKRGPHRVHIGVQADDSTSVVSWQLTKGARSRGGEEELVGRLLLNEAAAACGLADRLSLDLLPNEEPQRRRLTAPREWQELWTGQRSSWLAAGGAPPTGRRGLFPGAFHPLHAAHLRIAELAAQTLQLPVAFEISVVNVDKPPLDYLEIESRLAQFPASAAVWLTRASTFVEKARAFPDTTFVVGADTVARIAEPRYYGDSCEQRDTALARLAAHGARFLVFGRLAGDRFQTLQELDLPPALRRLCQGMGEDEFRLDLSSTELRRQQQVGD